MKYCILFVLFGIGSSLKSQDMNSCYTEENFEMTYHYIQWKKLTSKKLSENYKVLFDDGFELEVVEADGNRKIVCSKKNYSYFSVDSQKGIIPHTKAASDAKKYEKQYCQLVEIAKFKGLPKNYTYHYADGNANVWVITDKNLEYKPVTKEMSSSGMYDGGKPFTKEITETQYKEIQALLKKGLSNTAIHIENRVKGSGAISEGVTPTVTVNSKYIQMSSEEKKAIEAWLNAQKP